MKLRHVALPFLTVLLLLAVPSFVDAQTTPAAVSGTLTYRDRVALPANAVVTVQIAEVPTAGRSGLVIAEQRFTTNGAQPPFRYNIPYDSARIDAAKQYTVQANIKLGGQIRYATNTVYRVISQGAGVIDINLVLAPSPNRLPNTSERNVPLVVAGIALLAAGASFALRRAYAARTHTAA
ncbi:MAG: YbaY family lipoprotein [Chloroflexales bacterium]